MDTRDRKGGRIVKQKAIAFALIFILLGFLLLPWTIQAEEPQETVDDDDDTETTNKIYIAVGALLAMAIAGIVSSIALGHTGAAAMGVIAEKEEHFGSALILQVLPMTQGLYGLVVAILLVLGMGSADLTDASVGATAIAIGLVVALTGISAIPQGQIASAGIQSIPRNPELSTGKKVILAAMPETMAVFGILVAILLMNEAGLL